MIKKLGFVERLCVYVGGYIFLCLCDYEVEGELNICVLS